MENGRLREVKDRLATERGRLARVEQELGDARSRSASLERRREDVLRAREVLQLVARQTQERLEYHVSGLVSTALAAIWEDPYEFLVEFVERRGKTECDLLFGRGGEKCSPLDASGGGAVDVASFALRVAFLSMERPKSRRVLILDEPLKNLSGDLQEKASIMIKEISSKLGLQVILVSHAEDIINSADEVFEVEKSDEGISTVKVL